jgi:hypothetical protein
MRFAQSRKQALANTVMTDRSHTTAPVRAKYCLLGKYLAM